MMDIQHQRVTTKAAVNAKSPGNSGNVSKTKHRVSTVVNAKGTYVPRRGQEKLSPNFDKKIVGLNSKPKKSPKKG